MRSRTLAAGLGCLLLLLHASSAGAEDVSYDLDIDPRAIEQALLEHSICASEPASERDALQLPAPAQKLVLGASMVTTAITFLVAMQGGTTGDNAPPFAARLALGAGAVSYDGHF